jgi:hypothetical protein
MFNRTSAGGPAGLNKFFRAGTSALVTDADLDNG